MEELLLWEFPLKVREWATHLFFWSGVAIWIGLAARFLVPARVVRGPWLTLCLGFVGSCLGPFALRVFFNLERFDPIGPCGLLASVIVAVATLCLFYVVAFFFPSRVDDEEEEDEEEDEREARESDEFSEFQREEAGEKERRREQSKPPRRPKQVDRDRDRDERANELYRERGEYGRREYEYLEDESTKEKKERRSKRPSRPQR